jgi:hypothetical protein
MRCVALYSARKTLIPLCGTKAIDLIDNLVTTARLERHFIHKIHWNAISLLACEFDKTEWTTMRHGSSRISAVTNFTRRFTSGRSPAIISVEAELCNPIFSKDSTYQIQKRKNTYLTFHNWRRILPMSLVCLRQDTKDWKSYSTDLIRTSVNHSFGISYRPLTNGVCYSVTVGVVTLSVSQMALTVRWL